MAAALLIDFGSTYTKLRAIDLERRSLLGSGQGPSTVASDITIGMKAALVEPLTRDVGRLPGDADEFALDCALARAAVRIAVERHCGCVETVYTVNGPVAVQHGKDLSALHTVIGTGGALAHSRDAHAVLRMALADPAAPQSLRPRAPRLLFDRDYLLYACGLLGAVEPEAALELALKHLISAGDKPHERTFGA